MPAFRDKDTLWLQFGHGDLFVCDIHDSDTKETYGVAIIQSDPREIGSYWEEVSNNSLDKYDTKLIMEFHKIESIDVVIDVLQKAKEKMLNQMNA
jgi:hypothetical protein